MVESFKPKFNQTGWGLKGDVAREVVENIRTLGGRFLVEDTKAKGGVSAISESDVHPSILAKVWVPVENEKVIAKILHRLREKTGIAASPGAGRGKKPQQKNKKRPAAAAPKQKKVEVQQVSQGKTPPTVGDTKVGTSIPTCSSLQQTAVQDGAPPRQKQLDADPNKFVRPYLESESEDPRTVNVDVKSNLR